MTISLCDRDDEDNRFSFLLNFNKTHSSLPHQPKLTSVQAEIIKGFVKDLPKEMLVLFKQRYLEAKAYGEKNPMSYLLLEQGRQVNYFEMFPRNTEMLEFSFGEDKYFAEDSYELDPRVDNRNLQLAFYKLELDNQKQAPLFTYTYFFNEKSREEEDSKLNSENQEMILSLNRAMPNLLSVLKKRYKEAKEIGQKLLKTSSQRPMGTGKINRNELCPCGSGKKFKKCCGLRVN